MNLENSPKLWMPLGLLSNLVVKSAESGSEININAASNRFFDNVKTFNLSTDDDEDRTILQECLLIASGQTWESGVIITTHQGSLAVVSETVEDPFDDEFIFPVIWNARLEEASTPVSEEDYYQIFCEGMVGKRALVRAVVDSSSNVFWTEEDTARFWSEVAAK